jgi:hypothetical protein
MPWWRSGEVSDAIAAVTGARDDEGQHARVGTSDTAKEGTTKSLCGLALLVIVLAPTPRLTGSNEEEQHGKCDPDPYHL